MPEVGLTPAAQRDLEGLDTATPKREHPLAYLRAQSPRGTTASRCSNESRRVPMAMRQGQELAIVHANFLID